MQQNYTNRLLIYFIAIFLILGVSACNSGSSSSNNTDVITDKPITDPVQPNLNSSKLLSKYNLSLPANITNKGAANLFTGEIQGQQIKVQIPATLSNSNSIKLVANFELMGNHLEDANGKSQISAVTENNFVLNKETPFNVVAEDGSIAKYNILVTTREITARTIISYSIAGSAGFIVGNNITVTLPTGVTLADVDFNRAEIAIVGQSITRTLTAPDHDIHTRRQNYQVTSDSGASSTYTVVVREADNTSGELLNYAINGISGLISGSNITVVMPYGSNLTNALASFTSTGSQVKLNDVVQTSGVTLNNFEANNGNFTYNIFAADGSIKHSYQVQIIVAAADDKSILAYSVNGIPAQIFGNEIQVKIPVNLELEQLHPQIVSSGVKVTEIQNKVSFYSRLRKIFKTSEVNNQVPFKRYQVQASNGETKEYKVILTKNTMPKISFFSLSGYVAEIHESQIKLSLPYGSKLTQLLPRFVATGTVYRVDGDKEQALLNLISTEDFSQPVNYRVKLCNSEITSECTTKDYTVTVEVAAAIKDEISYYSLNGIIGVINQKDGTIKVTFPENTPNDNLLWMAATFTTTGDNRVYTQTVDGRLVQQISSYSLNNFVSGNKLKSVKYQLRRLDQIVKEYTVTIEKAGTEDDDNKNFINYSINGYPGLISGNSIIVHLPSANQYKADFTYAGEKITLDGISTTSGDDISSFLTNKDSLNYTISSKNGNKHEYKVTLIFGSLLNYSINGVVANIPSGKMDQKEITLYLPPGTNLKQTANFKLLDGFSAEVAGVEQHSGKNENNFSNPVSYLIKDKNGKYIETYTVTINISRFEYMYIATNNGINTYKVDASGNLLSGEVLQSISSPQIRSLVIHPNNHYLYASTLNGRCIEVYEINPITGGLQHQPEKKVCSSIDQPNNENGLFDIGSMIIDASGKYLYAFKGLNATSKMMLIINVDPNNGKLTYQSILPVGKFGTDVSGGESAEPMGAYIAELTKLEFSPDATQQFIYLRHSSFKNAKVYIYKRNPATGEIKFIQNLQETTIGQPRKGFIVLPNLDLALEISTRDGNKVEFKIYKYDQNTRMYNNKTSYTSSLPKWIGNIAQHITYDTKNNKLYVRMTEFSTSNSINDTMNFYAVQYAINTNDADNIRFEYQKSALIYSSASTSSSLITAFAIYLNPANSQLYMVENQGNDFYLTNSTNLSEPNALIPVKLLNQPKAIAVTNFTNAPA